MCIPEKLGPFMHCSSASLKRKFPPGKTHQRRIWDELGQPMVTTTHHRSGTTTWHYRTQEYWVPHPLSCAPMREVRRHELVLTFGANGVLEGIDRASH
jgi:hypothetical protein